MKKSMFSDHQILAILKQHEAEIPAAELAHEHSVSTALIYRLRSKHGGMDAALMNELKAENARLKKIYVKERLVAELRKEALD